MKPTTGKQQRILEIITALVAEKGRSVVLREIAERARQPVPTVYHIVKRLTAQGLLQRGTDGTGTGVQPALGDQRYGRGWRDALEYVRPQIDTTLVQHHASAPLTLAISQILTDAASAITEQPCDTIPASGPTSMSEPGSTPEES